MKLLRHASMMLAATAAVLTAHVASPQAPAIYDGLCLTSPYQWYNAAPNTGVPPATSATKTVDVSSGLPTSELLTNEPTPQVQLILTQGTLIIPPGVTSIKESIVPVQPPSVQPTDGTIDTNVYDISVTANGKDVAINPDHLAIIGMIATGKSEPQRTVEYFDGQTWKALDTQAAVGCGSVFLANTPKWGLFAVVEKSGNSGPAAATATDSGSGALPAMIIAIVVILILGAAGALLLRRRHVIAAQAAPGPKNRRKR